MWGRGEMPIGHLEDPGIAGRVILKWISEKLD
jgi:hypothetical protein